MQERHSKVYLVTYDHEGPSSKYAKLFDELKKSKHWWHYIDSTWLVVSTEGANEIYERLQPYLDDDINLLVIEVGRDRQGWLSEKAWNWIRRHLPRGRAD